MPSSSRAPREWPHAKDDAYRGRSRGDPDIGRDAGYDYQSPSNSMGPPPPGVDGRYEAGGMAPRYPPYYVPMPYGGAPGMPYSHLPPPNPGAHPMYHPGHGHAISRRPGEGMGRGNMYAGAGRPDAAIVDGENERETSSLRMPAGSPEHARHNSGDLGVSAHAAYSRRPASAYDRTRVHAERMQRPEQGSASAALGTSDLDRAPHSARLAAGAVEATDRSSADAQRLVRSTSSRGRKRPSPFRVSEETAPQRRVRGSSSMANVSIRTEKVIDFLHANRPVVVIQNFPRQQMMNEVKKHQLQRLDWIFESLRNFGTPGRNDDEMVMTRDQLVDAAHVLSNRFEGWIATLVELGRLRSDVILQELAGQDFPGSRVQVSQAVANQFSPPAPSTESSSGTQPGNNMSGQLGTQNSYVGHERALSLRKAENETLRKTITQLKKAKAAMEAKHADELRTLHAELEEFRRGESRCLSSFIKASMTTLKSIRERIDDSETEDGDDKGEDDNGNDTKETPAKSMP